MIRTKKIKSFFPNAQFNHLPSVGIPKFVCRHINFGDCHQNCDDLRRIFAILAILFADSLIIAKKQSQIWESSSKEILGYHRLRAVQKKNFLKELKKAE